MPSREHIGVLYDAGGLGGFLHIIEDSNVYFGKEAFCLFGVLVALFAQEPAPADPVIRVSVDLVQLDAVVRDSSGRHGRNLPADEFEILEDGKPQKISHFSFVPGGKGEKVVAGGGTSCCHADEGSGAQDGCSVG